MAQKSGVNINQTFSPQLHEAHKSGVNINQTFSPQLHETHKSGVNINQTFSPQLHEAHKSGVNINKTFSPQFHEAHKSGVNINQTVSPQLHEAQKSGALGLILYSDPADYAVDRDVEKFPKTWWLPSSGIQRGSTSLDKGGQLTPGYPAKGRSYTERSK